MGVAPHVRAEKNRQKLRLVKKIMAPAVKLKPVSQSTSGLKYSIKAGPRQARVDVSKTSKSDLKKWTRQLKSDTRRICCLAVKDYIQKDKWSAIKAAHNTTNRATSADPVTVYYTPKTSFTAGKNDVVGGYEDSYDLVSTQWNRRNLNLTSDLSELPNETRKAIQAHQAARDV